jgi:hypothetical protein
MTVVTREEAKSRIEELAAQCEPVRIEVSWGVEPELRHVAPRLPQKSRLGGQWAGKLEVGAKFFKSLPDDWLAEFENGPVFPVNAKEQETDAGIPE